MRLLIADDNSESLELLRIYLTSRGYEVVAVKDGLDAVRAALEQRFDGALIDCAMPSVDGFTTVEVLRLIEKRAMKPFLRVAFLTAHSDVIKDKDWLERLKVERVWAKPNSMPELPELIEAWLSN